MDPNRIDKSGPGRHGARPGAASVAIALEAGRANEAAMAARMSSARDARRDELMARTSSDGRPPSHRQRVMEWRWIGVGGILIIAGVITWFAIEGASVGAIVIGLMLGVLLLLVGASPVLAAGFLRGREEREARKDARFERQGRRTR